MTTETQYPTFTPLYPLEIFAAALFLDDTGVETLLDILDTGDDCEAHRIARGVLDEVIPD